MLTCLFRSDAVLHVGPHSSAQATVTDLQDGLRALDLRIREEVLEHHGELVQQSRHVQALEAAMQSIGGSVSSLQDSIARAQQEVTPTHHPGHIAHCAASFEICRGLLGFSFLCHIWVRMCCIIKSSRKNNCAWNDLPKSEGCWTALPGPSKR